MSKYNFQVLLLTFVLAAQTLDHLHYRAGIAHMNVKPANLMLLDSLETQLRLINFGFAQSMRSGSPCQVVVPESMHL